MKRSHILAAAACLGLAACGGEREAEESGIEEREGGSGLVRGEAEGEDEAGPEDRDGDAETGAEGDEREE